MKILCFTILSFWAFASHSGPFQLDIEQRFELREEVTSITLDFDDEVEIVEVAGGEIKITTLLTSEHQSVLEYQMGKQHFKLIPVYQTAGNKANMILKPKKINTSIFVNGCEQAATKRYRIEVPAHIQIVHL